MYTENKNITLEGYFPEWIAGKRNTVKPSTIGTYQRNYAAHISPALGKNKIQSLERRQILEFQSELARKLSARTANLVMIILKAILVDCVRDGIIAKSPAEFVKSLKEDKKKASETTHRALTKQEQEIFMQEARKDYYYTFFALMLTTGMRPGEVAGLQWSDLDYINGCIHVERTIAKDEKGTFRIGETTKSEAGQRIIPMTDSIKKILKEQKSTMRLLHGDVLPISNRVFETPTGGIVTTIQTSRAIKKILKRLTKAGQPLEYFSAHALRHTFATRYLESGGEMQTLKTILGHSSLAMTADLYAHVLPDTKAKEMDNLKITI